MKIYHLKTCDTNQRILKQLKSTFNTHSMTLSHRMSYKDFTFQEIKTQPITVAQLEEMYGFTQSYEALFSKRAKRYKLFKEQTLTEKDFKQLILDEYTFLKRPVIIVDDEIFVGNSKKNVDLLLEKITK
ncbi:MAG: ArsC/Spx/MgsR family protein [Flavobacteriaceae bacterium]